MRSIPFWLHHWHRSMQQLFELLSREIAYPPSWRRFILGQLRLTMTLIRSLTGSRLVCKTARRSELRLFKQLNLKARFKNFAEGFIKRKRNIQNDAKRIFVVRWPESWEETTPRLNIDWFWQKGTMFLENKCPLVLWFPFSFLNEKSIHIKIWIWMNIMSSLGLPNEKVDLLQKTFSP